MDKINIYTEQIKQEALRLGFDGCGISKAELLSDESPRFKEWLEKGYSADLDYMKNNIDKRLDPGKLFEGAKSVISLIINYFPEEKQHDREAPVLSKFAYGADYHYVLKKRLAGLLDFIVKKIPDSNGRIFVDSAPILERAWAKKSGLGWIGKNNLLINKEFGSFVFLGEVIVNTELNYDEEIGNLCGTCNKCISACPTGALVSEYKLNAGRCTSYYSLANKTDSIPEEFRNKFKNRVFGCDICQDVCPWNQKLKTTKINEFIPDPQLLTMSKDDWYNIEADEFNKLFKKSSVKESKYIGIKRNLEFIKGSLND